MDKRLRVIITSLRDIKAYGLNFIVTLISFPIFIVTMIFLWGVIYENATITEMTLPVLITYYVLVFMIGASVKQDIVAKWMSYDVRRGQMAIYLVRPIKYMTFLFFKRLGHFLVFFTLLAIVVIGTGFFYPLAVSSDLIIVGLFFLTTILALILSFLIFFTIGITAFWFEHNYGVIEIFDTVHHFLSGVMIPIIFFPSALASVAAVLPFQYIAYFPVTVLLGTITMDEVFVGIGIQIMWIAAMFLIANAFWKIGVKRFKGYGI